MNSVTIKKNLIFVKVSLTVFLAWRAVCYVLVTFPDLAGIVLILLRVKSILLIFGPDIHPRVKRTAYTAGRKTFHCGKGVA